MLSKKQVVSPRTRQENLRRNCTIAVLTALAFLCVALINIPVVLFLRYEPKDVIITLASLVFGPVSAIFMSVAVALIEMVTISSEGPVGMIMNILSTLSFVLPVSFLYKKRNNVKFVAGGLVIGSIFMLVVMLLWNFLITPMYMGVPREAVVDMLLPVFTPFNLLKAGINSALILLLLPVIGKLKNLNLIEKEKENKEKLKINPVSVFIGIFLLITCLLVVMVLNGTI